MNSPSHEVMATNAAIPAPHPRFSYASRTPARARTAAGPSGVIVMSGGSCATRVVTSPGWRATRARAVTAPPLLANISTGPAPSFVMTACTSSARVSGV
ncbi:hypothetical protein GA0115253_101778 [Streptomyces sp. Termitarium-T10T-6]|nr:hypothetical protein GA0115253_101778 [Streptomyces sp. Termitarium-T10T-6]